VALLIVSVGGAGADPRTCPGDCNGDGLVRINEVVRSVKAALVARERFTCAIPEQELCPRLDSCFFEDRNDDGSISLTELRLGIDRIVEVVRSSLYGCGDS
jgi:hypothetical protein